MPSLLQYIGHIGQALPEFRGRGRIAVTVSSLLLKAGVSPFVVCKMKAGHRLRLDCRLPSHCWALFSGCYDDRKQATLLSFLRQGGNALDVGANIGFYTVPMARRAKEVGGRAIAVEPVPSNATWLRYNLAINACEDVVDVHELGLSDQSGSSEIVLAEDFLGGGSVGNAVIPNGQPALWIQRHGPEYRRTSIRLETLDRIWPTDQRLDIVKLDIEGHEPHFLKGARNTLRAHRPVLLIEINRWHYLQQGLVIISPLLPPQYAFVELTPNGRLIEVDNLGRCRGWHDVFAVPLERMAEAVSPAA